MGAHRLCRALADAYAAGAEQAGHEVARIDLARVDFPLLRSAEDFAHGPLPAALQPAQDALLAAEHVVLVFPLWLGTMPALVKAFLEQVLRPDSFSGAPGRGFPRGQLAGRSARLVVTMGMPVLAYRWWFSGQPPGWPTALQLCVFCGPLRFLRCHPACFMPSVRRGVIVQKKD